MKTKAKIVRAINLSKMYTLNGEAGVGGGRVQFSRSNIKWR